VTPIADRVLDRLASGRHLLLLTNRDGTLAPIVQSSDAARLPQGGVRMQPQMGWTRGDCALGIREAVRRASGDRSMVVCLGDDCNDEHAFQALLGPALTISVGLRES
jgi:trehalose-6-phosphatase